jgi:hypothetical protein
MKLSREMKELARGFINRVGLAKTLVAIRKARGENVEHLMLPSLSDRFAAIYRNGVWLNERSSGSLSGRGSEHDSTREVRCRLPTLLAKLGTQRLIDIGCGDFTWMRSVELPCDYLGWDIVPLVIGRNSRTYGSSRVRFECCDAVSEHLPPADTVLCREVLFHLCFRDGLRLLQNIKRSGASFLIATNDTELRTNADILSGDYRMLNLHRQPFTFPAPIQSIPDDRVQPHRVLSVWELANIKA